MKSRPLARSCVGLVCLLISTLLWTGAASAQDDDRLTLRVEDVRVNEGGVAVVTLRTYAPRPVGSGQLCVRVKRRAARARGEQPDLELLEVRIFGSDNSTSNFIPDVDGGEIVASFTSALGVNRTDGPILAAFLRLGPNLAEDTELDLELDLANTSLLDSNGQEIMVDTRPGVLRVDGPTEPLALGVDGESHVPGEVPTIEVDTRKGWAVASGSFRLSVPESLADAGLTLFTRFQYGSLDAALVRENSTTMRIDFVSPGADFNEVPGAVFELRLPKTLEAGVYPLAFVSAQAIDPLSQAVPLVTEGGSLVITVTTYSASDFETADLADWSRAVGFP